MNRFQLENLYEVNGLKDYKLKTTDDLLRTHGINWGCNGHRQKRFKDCPPNLEG